MVSTGSLLVLSLLYSLLVSCPVVVMAELFILCTPAPDAKDPSVVLISHPTPSDPTDGLANCDDIRQEVLMLMEHCSQNAEGIADTSMVHHLTSFEYVQTMAWDNWRSNDFADRTLSSLTNHQEGATTATDSMGMPIQKRSWPSRNLAPILSSCTSSCYGGSNAAVTVSDPITCCLVCGLLCASPHPSSSQQQQRQQEQQEQHEQDKDGEAQQQIEGNTQLQSEGQNLRDLQTWTVGSSGSFDSYIANFLLPISERCTTEFQTLALQNLDGGKPNCLGTPAETVCHAFVVVTDGY